ncbi:hypothetical protein CCS01_24555 [Rhodopila globiformis]|uniref:Uncharacterized protein n=1 Tax=Rhodopila globiformis TaxID=1071 RepID=A0A2S6N0Z0_RHOGL|nr:hypothetical protein CCS01_24555 [Rhodopila globiformis]
MPHGESRAAGGCAQRGLVQPEVRRLSAGAVQSAETSALHLDALRDLKQVNAHLVAAAAYPVLETKGELLPSRLRYSRPQVSWDADGLSSSSWPGLSGPPIPARVPRQVARTSRAMTSEVRRRRVSTNLRSAVAPRGRHARHRREGLSGDPARRPAAAHGVGFQRNGPSGRRRHRRCYNVMVGRPAMAGRGSPPRST